MVRLRKLLIIICKLHSVGATFKPGHVIFETII